MSQIQIFIVEDEPVVADDIAATLEEIGYAVCGMADNAAEALEKIEKSAPDLVLVDISIEGKTDGIDLAKKIHDRYKIPFVYLTSHSDKLTLERVKQTSPSGYIVKPFSEGDLLANIELALHQFSLAGSAAGASKNSFNAGEKNIFIKTKNHFLKINLKDIFWAEAYDNYAYIRTEKEKYLLSSTLKSVEEKLSANGFIRVHKSFLVNLEKISSITEGYVILGNDKVPIGKVYRENLMKVLNFL